MQIANNELNVDKWAERFINVGSAYLVHTWIDFKKLMREPTK